MHTNVPTILALPLLLFMSTVSILKGKARMKVRTGTMLMKAHEKVADVY